MQEARLRLLDAALAAVPKYSFTNSALRHAASQVGLPQSSLLELTPRDLALHLHERGLEHVRQRAQENFTKTTTTTQSLLDRPDRPGEVARTVAMLARSRLEFAAPYAAFRADSIRALGGVFQYTAALWKLSDEIWWCAAWQRSGSSAGGRPIALEREAENGYAYYTRRAILAHVYRQCEQLQEAQLQGAALKSGACGIIGQSWCQINSDAAAVPQDPFEHLDTELHRIPRAMGTSAARLRMIFQ